MKIITARNAPAAIGPYSQAIKAGDFLYISGQIGLSPLNGELVQSSIEDETAQTLSNIKAILASEGLGFRDVMEATLYLGDMDNFERVNLVYQTHLEGHKPARATVEVSRLPLNANIEIKMTAYYRKEDRSE